MFVAAVTSIPNAYGVTIVHGGDSVDIDFVDIGNAGNVADTNGKGAVSYEYSIGTYEITSSQWATVTTADANIETGTNSDPYTGSQPTAEVSWYEAAKFANWLTSGDALLGAYQFSDATTFTGVDRVAALNTYDTIYMLPTEDEWYKAAYFKSDGSGYTDYPTGDGSPIAGIDANFLSANSSPWDVGSGSVENNNTFDMGGNVFEWTESSSSGSRLIRGGQWWGSANNMTSAASLAFNPASEEDWIGFRLVSISTVPEPSSLSLLFIGVLGCVLRRKRG